MSILLTDGPSSSSSSHAFYSLYHFSHSTSSLLLLAAHSRRPPYPVLSLYRCGSNYFLSIEASELTGMECHARSRRRIGALAVDGMRCGVWLPISGRVAAPPGRNTEVKAWAQQSARLYRWKYRSRDRCFWACGKIGSSVSHLLELRNKAHVVMVF